MGSPIFHLFAFVNPFELFRGHLNQESATEFVKNGRQNLFPGGFALKIGFRIFLAEQIQNISHRPELSKVFLF